MIPFLIDILEKTKQQGPVIASHICGCQRLEMTERLTTETQGKFGGNRNSLCIICDGNLHDHI
jgi:hypothetical protein